MHVKRLAPPEEPTILRLDEFKKIRRAHKPERESYRVKTLDDLHHVILNWIPLTLEENPLSALLAEVKEKSSFDSEADYTKTFEPLILEEIRSCLVNELQTLGQLSRAQTVGYDVNGTLLKVESPQKHEAVFGKSIYDNTGGFDVLSLKLEVPPNASSRRETTTAGRRSPSVVSGVSIEAGDLILLKLGKDSSGPKPTIPVFAYVTNIVRRNGVIHFAVRTKLAGRCTKPNADQRVYANKLLNMQTHHRQYQALWGIRKLHVSLINSLLRPSSYVKPKRMGSKQERREESQRIGTLCNLNRAQTRAVFATTSPVQKSSEASQCSLTLLQGPPGTGKTSTIIAMITRLLRKKHIDSSKNQKRVLICAPSNAAVDGIMKRVLQKGIEFRNGQYATPWSLRIGNGSTDPIISSLTPIARFKRQSTRLSNSKESSLLSKRASLLQEVRKVSSLIGDADRKRKTKRQENADVQDKSAEDNASGEERALTNKLCELHEAKNALLAQLDVLGKKLTLLRTRREKDRTEQLTAIVSRATLVFTTLNSSGADVLKLCKSAFSAIIIDEAAQSVELETLVPIVNYPCSNIIFVGDPMQLPATVISNHPKMRSLYRRSLFERLVKQDFRPVYFLKRQYRMHPTISWLPSQLFYSGRLKNGVLASAAYQRPFHTDPARRFGPISFIDTTSFHGSREERTSSGSTRNRAEAVIAAITIASLLRRYSSFVASSNICVLTPYRAQIREIENELAHFEDLQTGNIQVSTVDSIQGREKDIVIFSAVRGGGNDIGFVRDLQRMNVAITRSKVALIVIGNGRGLSRADSNWAALVDRCHELGSHLQLHGSLRRSFPEAYDPQTQSATGPFNYLPIPHDNECESSSSSESEQEIDERNQYCQNVAKPREQKGSTPTSHAKLVLERVKQESLKEDLERKRNKWRQALLLEEAKSVVSPTVSALKRKNRNQGTNHDRTANGSQTAIASLRGLPKKTREHHTLNRGSQRPSVTHRALPSTPKQRLPLKRPMELRELQVLAPSAKVRKLPLPAVPLPSRFRVARKTSIVTDKVKLMKLRALKGKGKQLQTLATPRSSVATFSLSQAVNDIRTTASRGSRK